MVVKKTLGERIFDKINIVLMIFIIAITVYPVYYVVVCSLSDGNQLMNMRGLMLAPKGLNFAAYKSVVDNPNIFSGYGVTLIVVVVGTILSVFLTAIGAFLITRNEFPMAKPLSYLMVFTMYFSGGMIPTFIIVNNVLDLGDTLWALILPGAISVYNLLIMRSNFEALPRSLEEAAEIDGANDIIVLFRIILPLSKSIMAVMVLFYAVTYWNAWFEAMLYIRDKSMYPLQLVLREILMANDMTSMGDGGAVQDRYMIGETIKYATIVVATLPILCLYPFIQRYFVKGVMVGAVKG